MALARSIGVEQEVFEWIAKADLIVVGRVLEIQQSVYGVAMFRWEVVVEVEEVLHGMVPVGRTVSALIHSPSMEKINLGARITWHLSDDWGEMPSSVFVGEQLHFSHGTIRRILDKLRP